MTDQFDGLLTDFSDEVLVDSAMLGDHAAFDVIVRRYGPHLYRFARRLLASESDVDDIVQETCVAAWRQLPGFQRRSSTKTWLFAICSRKISDVHRKVGSCAADVDGLRDEVDTRLRDPSEEVCGTAFLDALEAELDRLPLRQRAAWVLREVEGMTYPQIAVVLELSPDAVRGQHTRARRNLGVALDRWR